MQTMYESWINKPVVLQVVIADVLVDLRGTLAGESATTIRLRIDGHWDFDVSKDVIVSVEHDFPHYSGQVLAPAYH
ncbi:MAG TPA: hypothetical protein VKR82_15860 [Candidatus Acidoferrales bacterium]|nr:hypothetical protein [Candidatus Acidoferrales bacterium]